MQSFVYKGYFYGEGLKEGRELGLEQVLLHLVERRIRRPMTPGERRRIALRLRKDRAKSLVDAVLDLSHEELTAWLAPNGHRTNGRRAA